MPKIKLLIINESKFVGGGETWINYFIDSVEDPNIQIFVLCPYGPTTDLLNDKPVTIINRKFHWTDLSTKKLHRYFFYGISLLIDSLVVRWLIYKHKINILHSISISGHIIGSIQRFISSVKSVQHIHFLSNKAIFNLFPASVTVFVAKFTRDKVFQPNSKNFKQSRVFYNGIQIPSLASINLPQGDIRDIGFVGRINPAKGLSELLEAFLLFKNNPFNVKLQIFGTESFQEYLQGEYTETLKKFVTDNQIEKSVNFRGFVHPQGKIYEEIDLLILPSYMEACPMVILESWAAGVPVIATDVGGIPELITHGVTGYLIPAKNPQAIADAVKHAIENPDEVRQIVENARKLVEEKFDYRDNARKFIELYKELLNDGS